MADLSCLLVHLRGWFIERGYPADFVDKQLAGITHNKVRKPKEKVNDSVGIPFVVTYHPCLANLPSIVRRNYYLLQSNEGFK